MTTAPERLDQATIDLIFALRDSNTEVDALDFWTSRVATAIETAAAGGENWPQAVTIATRKLQIETLTEKASQAVVAAGAGLNFAEWQRHVARNLVYIVALARVENTTRKETRKAARAAAEELPNF